MACFLIGAAILGAGITAAASGGSTQPTPTTPNPGPTDASVLQAQIDLAPQQFAAEQEFDPQYAQLYQSIIGQSLLGNPATGEQGLLSLYSQAAPQEQAIQNQLNTQQLQGNLGNLQSLGGSAVSAFTNANPLLGQVQSGMVNQAQNFAGANQVYAGSGPVNQLMYGTPGGASLMSNPTLNALNASTQQQLALGGALPSQTTSDISNQVLSSMNTMGRAQDPAAAANLALSLNSNQQAMLQQRQAAAGNAASLTSQYNLGQQQTLLGGYESGNQLGLQAQLANQTGGLQSQALQNQLYGSANSALMGSTMPALGTVLSPSTAFGATGSLYSQAGSTGTGSTNFNPFQYGTSLYSNQYQDTYGQNGSGQFNALTNQGFASAGSSLFSSALGAYAMCWVAREVYGTADNRWLRIRNWMLTKAPAAIRADYLQAGEYLAWRLASLPRLKARIQESFDQILTMQEAA